MANYLPVLLVSVNANAIPDDNALTTIPRGQVDYLSHDWQEEDVWRSWRNMTRQKNEIANGVRLENASWRTWWKQRNKLKTISPATLNWLKDSDVTWLYGPLHTAVDWAPPLRPKPASDQATDSHDPLIHDTLHRPSSSTSTLQQPSTQPPRTKPILKYRSISELLTSDLPVSPLFSPHESEDDSRPTFSGASEEKPSQPSQPTSLPKRPALVHTKSDTHITRWGPSRAFRKDSPPRVAPPSSSRRQSSLSNKQPKLVHAPSAVRNSLSQDSASSTSGGSSERKKKHISFNTFVEQCIAIEKPKQGRRSKRRTGGFGFGEFIECEDEEYDSEDDDGEDDDDSELWGNRWHSGYMEDQVAEGSITSIYGGTTYTPYRTLAGSAVYTDSDSDDAIEIRPASYRRSSISGQNIKKKATPRSKSVSSSSSSATTSTTTTTSGSSSSKRSRRKSASAATPLALELLQPPHQSAYRPRPINFPDAISRDRVTIAPIAPTLLKTTGAWEEGFGDEDGISDDGLFDFGLPRHGVNDKSRNSADNGAKRGVGGEEQREEGFSSEGTPVELVYVPPFGSIYGVNAMNYWTGRDKAVGEDDDDGDGDEEMEEAEEVESHVVSPFGEKRDQEQEVLLAEKPVERDVSMQVNVQNPPIPILLVKPAQSGQRVADDGDEEDREASENTPTAVSRTPAFVPSSRRIVHDEGTEFRGRSLSVSPVGNDGTRTPPYTSPPNGGSTFASRGRSQSFQDLPSLHRASLSVALASASQSGDRGERRGRSNLRAPSGASGFGSSSGSRGQASSSRSTSHQSHSAGPSSRNGSLSPNNASASPMGSLSPDGSDSGSRLGGIGIAYVGGRTGGRERERGGGSSSSLNTSGWSGGGGEERRGRDRGKRALVAEYGSGAGGSGSSTSPAALPDGTSEGSGRGRTRRRFSVSPSDVIEAGVPLASEDVKGKGKENELERRQQAGTSVASDSGSTILEVDASTCSASSEGSTVVPSQPVATSPSIFAPSPSLMQSQTPVSIPESHVRIDGKEELDQEGEGWRKSVPTPLNSPEIRMTAPRFAAMSKSENPTIVQASSSMRTTAPLAGHVRAGSLQSQSTPRSGSKTRSSPPIAPSPPHPALPSTSTSYVPGELDPPSLTTAIGGKRFSTSLDRASSGSRERGSPASTSSRTGPSQLRREISDDTEIKRMREFAEARRGRSASVDVRVRADNSNDSAFPVTRPERERGTIIGKAVGMVSNAYLRLWQNH